MQGVNHHPDVPSTRVSEVNQGIGNVVTTRMSVKLVPVQEQFVSNCLQLVFYFTTVDSDVNLILVSFSFQLPTQR